MHQSLARQNLKAYILIKSVGGTTRTKKNDKNRYNVFVARKLNAKISKSPKFLMKLRRRLGHPMRMSNMT